MPKITPHVCGHTYYPNQAKSEMSPKTMQYLMSHSDNDIGVTMNTYTHIWLEYATEEIHQIEELKMVMAEMDKLNGKKILMKQSQLRVV